MKLNLSLIVILFSFFSCGESDDTEEEKPTPTATCSGLVSGASPQGNNDVLVWADEFNEDGSPCSENWTYDVGNGSGGWGNQEVQYYRKNDPDNVIVADGVLKITAKKEVYLGYPYTSTRLKSQGKFNFTYGKLEVRAKLPKSQGTWPAIWMLGSNFPTVGWPSCGEIDIMEQKGAEKNRVLGTCHWLNSSNNANANHSDNTLISNASSEFHVYTLEWDKNKITMHLDNVKYYELTLNSNLPFHSDFFIILNIAMGGTLGGVIDPAFTEDVMEIDYIRVYQ